ncbi:MAG: hypothetical protein V4615_07390 [Bacteroidota bacterium]
MKRFVTHTLLFITPVLLIALCLELLLRNIPNDYSYKKNYLDKHSDSLEVLYLGSSHMYRGINPEFSQMKGFNAAMVSQTLEYDYKIFQLYSEHLASLKWVVISVSSFSYFQRLETSKESWRIKNYTIYWRLTDGSKVADHIEILSSKLRLNIARLYNYYILNQPNIYCSELGWGRRQSNFSPTDKNKTGNEAAERHNKAGEEGYEGNIKLVEDIIRTAQQKNIRVLLFTPPAYSTYTTHLDNERLLYTIKKSEAIARAHSNCSYINLLSDSTFGEEDFFDADHLNSAGARKLTQKIDSLL